MQLPNLCALKTVHKAAPTGYIDVPEVEDARVQEALQALYNRYNDDNPGDDMAGEKAARLGGLNLVPWNLRSNKQILEYFLRLNPNNIYYLEGIMFESGYEWILDYAVSRYANPESYLMHFRIVEDDPDGPAAQLFVKYFVYGGKLPLVLRALDWNRTSYSNVMTDMRTADAGGHTTVGFDHLVRDYTFNARANEIYAECFISNMDLRRDIWNQQFPFDYTSLPAGIREQNEARLALTFLREFQDPDVAQANGDGLALNIANNHRHFHAQGFRPEDPEPPPLIFNMLEHRWYHTHMTMALIRIITAIPEANSIMTGDSTTRIYTKYMCLEEMVRQQRAAKVHFTNRFNGYNYIQFMNRRNR